MAAATQNLPSQATPEKALLTYDVKIQIKEKTCDNERTYSIKKRALKSLMSEICFGLTIWFQVHKKEVVKVSTSKIGPTPPWPQRPQSWQHLQALGQLAPQPFAPESWWTRS